VDLGAATSLAQLAEVIAGAEAIVVGNTGPAHLAAAVGTPVVSLYAPTVPAARWRPWKVAHRLLYADVVCAGCRARQCPVPGHPCLGGVGVAEVLEALDGLPAGAARRETRAS
ncbi:MAG TPA: glycosyltransferase family 9 protein, partial [Egibacteraceae bacterium]|nr:glycosyltransferase family 9 protein [Egibacteraceae bacterium]